MSMDDLADWVPIDCDERDYLIDGPRPLSVASSLTDLEGRFGTPVIFTEWWLDDQPVLRDYLENPHAVDGGSCRHYAWRAR